MQRRALCRSRRELSNEYLLDEIGVDTAESEPLEVWGKIQFTIHFTPYSRPLVLLSARVRSRRLLTALRGVRQREGRCIIHPVGGCSPFELQQVLPLLVGAALDSVLN